MLQSFQDFAILRSLNLSQNQANSAISIIAADFPQILALDASRDVIAMRNWSKKGCFSVWKMEWTALRSHHADLQELHWTNEIRATRLSYATQTVYLLGPEPQLFPALQSFK